MIPIEPKMNPSVAAPRMTIERNDLAVCRKDHCIIPHKRVQPQLAITVDKLVQEIAKRRAVRIGGIEPYPAIQLPTGDEDKPLRPLERLGENGKISGAVYENRRPACPGNCAAVSPFYAQAGDFEM